MDDMLFVECKYSLNAHFCLQIRGGSIAEGSELQLEIAEFSWRDVKVAPILILSLWYSYASRSVRSNILALYVYGLLFDTGCTFHDLKKILGCLKRRFSGLVSVCGQMNGSLLVQAANIMGSVQTSANDAEGILQYGTG